MSRHRDIRRMNYDEEYEGYDEVLGRSVEDDFCVSPGSAEFLYDRNARQQLTAAAFLSDDDIPEEGELEDDETAADKPRAGRQDSLDYVRPELNHIDEARLRSCLDEIHNIVGDSIPEHVLVASVMENGFNLEKSLDQILSGATSSAPSGAGHAAPKPRRERSDARTGDHLKFSSTATAEAASSRTATKLPTAEDGAQESRFPTAPSSEGSPLFSMSNRTNPPSFGETVRSHGIQGVAGITPLSLLASRHFNLGSDVTQSSSLAQLAGQRGNPMNPVGAPGLFQLSGRPAVQGVRPLFGGTHVAVGTSESSRQQPNLVSTPGMTSLFGTMTVPPLPNMMLNRGSTTQSANPVHGPGGTSTVTSGSDVTQSSSLAQLAGQHGNVMNPVGAPGLFQLSGRPAVQGVRPLFGGTHVATRTSESSHQQPNLASSPRTSSLFGTMMVPPPPNMMLNRGSAQSANPANNCSESSTETASDSSSSSPLSRLAKQHLNHTQGSIFGGRIDGSRANQGIFTPVPVRPTDLKSLAAAAEASDEVADVGNSDRDSPVFDLTAALRDTATKSPDSLMLVGAAVELSETMGSSRVDDDEDPIPDLSEELLRGHRLLLANKFVKEMAAKPSWFALVLCLRLRVRVLATPTNTRPASPLPEDCGAHDRRKKRFAFDTPSPDAVVLAAQARPFGTRSEGAVRQAVSPIVSSSDVVKMVDVNREVRSIAEGVTKLRFPPSKPATLRLTPDEPASDAELPKSSRVSPDIPGSDKIGNVSILDLDSGSREQSARSTPNRVPREPKVDARREYERQRGGGKDLLNLVVIGHVDAGKSTLMGHLLCLMGAISQKTMHKHEQEAKKIGKASFMYAWVLDETGEERSRGVTMDVGYSRFETPRKVVTLLDAPGHRDFIPNMITGASQADVAMLVVDATRGEFETGFETGGQTREHALLVRSLGVAQLIVAVNKLDTVMWSQERYQYIVKTIGQFLKQAGFKEADLSYIPCSGLTGENLTDAPKDKSFVEWYSGPSLLEQIDQFQSPERPVTKPFRLCVSDVFRGQGSAFSVAGKVETGMVSTGDRVLVAPLGELCAVKNITMDESSATTAFAGDQVVLTVTGIEQANVTVGCVICDPAQPISVASRFRARIVVFNFDMPITKGFQAVLHYQSLCEPVIIKRLISQLHKSTGEALKKRPRCLTKHSNAMVELEVSRPICIEVYKDIKELGRFMLRSGGFTVAAGLVTEIL